MEQSQNDFPLLDKLNTKRGINSLIMGTLKDKGFIASIDQMLQGKSKTCSAQPEFSYGETLAVLLCKLCSNNTPISKLNRYAAQMPLAEWLERSQVNPKNLKPECVSDLFAAIAVYRPERFYKAAARVLCSASAHFSKISQPNINTSSLTELCRQNVRVVVLNRQYWDYDTAYACTQMELGVIGQVKQRAVYQAADDLDDADAWSYCDIDGTLCNPRSAFYKIGFAGTLTLEPDYYVQNQDNFLEGYFIIVDDIHQYGIWTTFSGKIKGGSFEQYQQQEIAWILKCCKYNDDVNSEAQHYTACYRDRGINFTKRAFFYEDAFYAPNVSAIDTLSTVFKLTRLVQHVITTKLNNTAKVKNKWLQWRQNMEQVQKILNGSNSPV